MMIQFTQRAQWITQCAIILHTNCVHVDSICFISHFHFLLLELTFCNSLILISTDGRLQKHWTYKTEFRELSESPSVPLLSTSPLLHLTHWNQGSHLFWIWEWCADHSSFNFIIRADLSYRDNVLVYWKISCNTDIWIWSKHSWTWLWYWWWCSALQWCRLLWTGHNDVSCESSARRRGGIIEEFTAENNYLSSIDPSCLRIWMIVMIN